LHKTLKGKLSEVKGRSELEEFAYTCARTDEMACSGRPTMQMIGCLGATEQRDAVPIPSDAETWGIQVHKSKMHPAIIDSASISERSTITSA